MSPPWKTSTKQISTITNNKFTVNNSQILQSFNPPTLPTRIDFSISALSASAARAAASSITSQPVLAALALSTESLVSAIVDDSGPDFAVDNNFFQLQDVEKTGLSSRVGSAICDLVCAKYGYVWRCLASELMQTKSKLGDYLYEGGPASGQGVVMVEAKGSISKRTTTVSIEKNAKDGFTYQVEPHLGTTTSAGNIIYGYAISSGVKPGTNPSNASIHISEPVLSSGSGGRNLADGDIPKSGRVTQEMALRNYRSVFLLCGAHIIVHAIDYLLGGSGEKYPDKEQRFYRLEYGDKAFLTCVTDEYTPPYLGWPFLRKSFAIAEDVAMPFLQQLTSKLRNHTEEPSGFELPITPLNLVSQPTRPIQFQDGFAYLDLWPRGWRESNSRWKSNGGYSNAVS